MGAITGYISEGIPASRIDLNAFQAWADWCKDISEGAAPTPITLECHIYFDTTFSLRKAIDMVSLNGRGTVVQLGSKFTVIVDKAEEIAVQRFLFTMGNIKKDSFAEEFLPMDDRANAVAITYFDREMDYIRQTVEVYSDDFDTSDRDINKTSITLYGCVSRYQATDHGAFLIKCNRYVTLTVSFDTDVDAIACRPGDVIDVAHDVPNWGISGRVVSATANTITLDQEVPIDDSLQYMVGIKHIDDDDREEIEVDAVTMGSGNYSELQMLSSWNKTPAAGALYYFGEIDQLTKAIRILRISRASDQRRKLSGVEYVPEVYARAGSVTTPDLPEEQSKACIGLTATEIWSGGTISSVSLSWRGFALTWYVYKNDGSSWVLLGTTSGLNYTDSGLSYGIDYVFSVSPTANPNDTDAAHITVNVSGANIKIEISNNVGIVDEWDRIATYLRKHLEEIGVETSPETIYKLKLLDNVGIEDAIKFIMSGDRSLKLSENIGLTDSIQFGISGDRFLKAIDGNNTPPSLFDNLVAYWPLEENSLDIINSHNGSDSDIIYENSAAKFNGSSSIINFGNNSDLDITGPMSIAMWLKPIANPSNGKYLYFGKVDDYKGYAFILQYNADMRGETGHSSSPWDDTAASTGVLVDTWAHWIFIYDGSFLRLYKNGTQVGTDVSFSSGIPSTGTGVDFKIGGHYSNPWTYGFFNGYVSHMGVWNKALSEQEISNLYNGGSRQTPILQGISVSDFVIPIVNP